jgi:hypothetical protein
MERLEVLDAGGEPVNIGSPVPGAPAPKKKSPAEPQEKPKPAPVLRPVEILLVDDLGAPLGKLSYTARFPDGKTESGSSDGDGKIRFPENTQSGDLQLTLTDAETQA